MIAQERLLKICKVAQHLPAISIMKDSGRFDPTVLLLDENEGAEIILVPEVIFSTKQGQFYLKKEILDRCKDPRVEAVSVTTLVSQGFLSTEEIVDLSDRFKNLGSIPSMQALEGMGFLKTEPSIMTVIETRSNRSAMINTKVTLDPLEFGETKIRTDTTFAKGVLTNFFDGISR